MNTPAGARLPRGAAEKHGVRVQRDEGGLRITEPTLWDTQHSTPLCLVHVPNKHKNRQPPCLQSPVTPLGLGTCTTLQPSRALQIVGDSKWGRGVGEVGLGALWVLGVFAVNQPSLSVQDSNTFFLH